MPPTAAARDQKTDERGGPDGDLAERDHDADQDGVRERATSAWMGLTRAADANCDWIDVGFDLSKNPGLASFWSPAKTKVPPRKARSGRRAHPAIDVA